MGTFLKICGLLIAFAGIYGIYKPTWLANQKTGEVPSRAAIFFGCLFGSLMLFFASGLFTKNAVEVAEVKVQAVEPVKQDSNTEDMRNKFKAKITNGSEPKVKDATWTSPSDLKIGVLADGTNRDGYADYFCIELRGAGFKSDYLKVHIIDIAKLQKDNDWTDIGQKVCENLK